MRPSYERTATVAEMLLDAKATDLLARGGLLGLLGQLPAQDTVRLFAWEGPCDGSEGQLALGVFRSASDEVVTVSGKELFFLRREVSSH